MTEDNDILPETKDFPYDEAWDDDKRFALRMAVTYWGMVAQNPESTPAKINSILQTADQFIRWLQG